MKPAGQKIVDLKFNNQQEETHLIRPVG